MDPADDDQLRRAKARLGTVLRDKYRLERLLGLGGMAAVYQATHRNKAEFAIKMLHAEYNVRADIRARFLREGYAANSVKHPGVVRVVDDDVAEDGTAFVVMDLLEGAEVERVTEERGGKLSVREVVLLGVKLLDVLAAAHEKGIVHRDIKPANFFVTKDGQVRLLDFGIARVRDAVQGGVSATGGGLVLGTPAFMSPEQAKGHVAEGEELKVDLWAVGATLFTLAAGRTVHVAQTAQHLVILAATQPAVSLATLLPGVPVKVAKVIDRALAFDPKDRWETAAAMRDALLEAARDSFGETLDDRELLDLAQRAGTLSSVRVPFGESGAQAIASASGPGADPPRAKSGAASLISGADTVAIADLKASDPVLAGAARTTVRPVAGAPEISAPRKRRPTTLVAVLAALGVGLGGGLYGANELGRRSAHDGPARSAPAPTTEARPQSSGATATASVATVPAPLAPPTVSVPTANPRGAMPSGTGRRAKPPVSTAPPPPSASARAGCTMVSWVDAEGYVHFREQCPP